eukprot:4694251-Prymnesium_polylepis.1
MPAAHTTPLLEGLAKTAGPAAAAAAAAPRAAVAAEVVAEPAPAGGSAGGCCWLRLELWLRLSRPSR